MTSQITICAIFGSFFREEQPLKSSFRWPQIKWFSFWVDDHLSTCPPPPPAPHPSHPPHPPPLLILSSPTLIPFSRIVFSSPYHEVHLSPVCESGCARMCILVSVECACICVCVCVCEDNCSVKEAQWKGNMCHVLASPRRRERSISVATNGGVQAAFNNRDLPLQTHTHTHTHTRTHARAHKALEKKG